MTFCARCNRRAQEVIVTIHGTLVTRCQCGYMWEHGSASMPVGTIYYYTSGDGGKYTLKNGETHSGRFFRLSPGANERPVMVKDAEILAFCHRSIMETRRTNSINPAGRIGDEAECR